MSVDPGGTGAGPGTTRGTAPGARPGAAGHTGDGVADTIARHVKTPETKEFFKTSEFLVWGLTVLGILIAAAMIGGDDDNFVGDEAWRYVAIVSAAYIVSRGISKAGTQRGRGDAPMDRY